MELRNKLILILFVISCHVYSQIIQQQIVKKITNCSLTDCRINILETVYNIFQVYSVFVFVCFFLLLARTSQCITVPTLYDFK